MVNKCDTCRKEETEVRKMDLGGGGAVCLCARCWAKAVARMFRKGIEGHWFWPEKPNTTDE